MRVIFQYALKILPKEECQVSYLEGLITAAMVYSLLNSVQPLGLAELALLHDYNYYVSNELFQLILPLTERNDYSISKLSKII